MSSVMVPNALVTVLRCVACGAGPLDVGDAELVCGACGRAYSVRDGVPSLLLSGVEAQDWNPWSLEKLRMTAESYVRRAKGEIPEKEAAKSCARFLKAQGLHRPGGTILDIGCATGHFLRSFRRLMDSSVRYTGIDINLPFLLWGAEIFGLDDTCSFVHGDSLRMPFVDGACDVVFVNLFHFFPNIEQALRESLRVARRHVVWRTPLGETNYIVRVLHQNGFEDLGALTPERRDFEHTLYMLYSEEYIRGLVAHLGAVLRLIHRDDDFQPFDNTALPEFQGVPVTRTVNGMQVNGNLILDWHYIVIDKLDRADGSASSKAGEDGITT